ncbi:MAG: hypothetical protein ACREXK_12350 [Gammaproteobacteria bacterium]
MQQGADPRRIKSVGPNRWIESVQHQEHHLFCKHCGVRAFGRGNSPDLGGTVYGVNVTASTT